MKLSKIKRFFGLKRDKILVVDDVDSNVELIRSYLKFLNSVKVYGYTNPIKSEEILRKIDFSLIILDIQMPVMDGYQLATNIKLNKYGKNSETPIIFITGIYNSDIDKIRGYNIGSIDYLLKPIKFDDFNKKIENYLDTNDIIDKRMENIKKSINM